MNSENLSECMQDGNRGVYIDVAISPNSSRDEITGVNQWRDNLEISIKAEPTEGKANTALIDFLSQSLEISKEKISITKGKRSENKRIFISEISEEEIQKKILNMFEDRK